MAPSTDDVFKNSIGIALSHKEALKIDNTVARVKIEESALGKPSHLNEK